MLLARGALPLVPLLLHRHAAPRCCDEPSTGDKIARAQSLESQLTLAIESERYADAATFRDELASLNLDSELAVVQTNAAFYSAFTEGDSRAMDEVWASDGLITCTHPGHAPLVGRAEVMKSWQQIFKGSEQQMRISAANVQCSVQGGLAYVTCVEKIVPGDNKMAAVNVFALQADGSWRMVVHSAGPVLV